MPTASTPFPLRMPGCMRALRWLLPCALMLASAPSLHAQAPPSSGEVPASFQVGPAVSGSWFTPERSGEGVIVQFLPDGSVAATWFTYPPAGEPGTQAWMIAQGGVVDGDSIRFDSVLRPIGARFGEAFDPAAVVLQPWGTMELRFGDCHSATLIYAGPPAFGSGERPLARLTEIDEIDCNGSSRDLLASGARAPAGLRSRSGAWYVPSRPGEGWLVEELDDSLVGVYWFTHAPDGQQAWTFGIGTRSGDHVVLEDTYITSGTRFGDGFVAADVEVLPWGRLEVHFDDCGSARVAYESPLPGFGAAARDAGRLVALGGHACLDAFPEPLATGSWSEHAGMPAPFQSEHDVAVLDGHFYALGGFGDARGFKRYDPVGNHWSVLPPLPAGRDHLSAFALDGSVFMVGGAARGGGDQGSAAFRWDRASGVWTALPEIDWTFGSRATVLFGHAFIGDADGSLQQYDPRHRRVHHIAHAGPARDHAQVLAFLGEVWVLGGRIPDTARVSIYDPSSGRWREGPPMNAPRGGFAAAVVGDRILVGGGEVIRSGVYLQRTTEIYGAGSEAWLRGPVLPEPVHGTAGAAHAGRFYVVGGSTIAGSAEGQNGRVFSLGLHP